MWSGDELCWSVQGHRRQAIGYGLEYFYSEERLPVSAHWKMTWQQENESGWLMRRRVITGTGSTRTRSASFKTSFLLLPSCRLVRSLCRQYKKQFLSHTLYLPEGWTESPSSGKAIHSHTFSTFLKFEQIHSQALLYNSFSHFFYIHQG